MKILHEVTKDTFVISDTHFFHKNIEEYEPTRQIYKELGYESQEEFMIDKWNSVVEDDDIVIHLGDFSFEKADILKSLKGRKILVKGNHDHLPLYYYNDIFELIVKGGTILGICDGYEIEIGTGHKYANGLILDIDDVRIMFTHIPAIRYLPFDTRYGEVLHVLNDIFLMHNCDFNVHGHIHLKETLLSNFINVCVECIDFRPVQLKEIISFKGVWNGPTTMDHKQETYWYCRATN